MKKSNTMTANTKANLIAIAVMAAILTVGVIYGLQLENAFYLTENY
jgi:hypothetical protein